MLNNEDGKGCAATDTGRLDFSHVSAGSTRKIYFAQGDPVLPSGYVVPEKVEPETPEETADSSLTDEEAPQAAPADGVVRGQQRGGGKAAGLIALDAAHHQDHLPALVAQAHQGKVQRGHRGRGRSPRPQAAKNRQGQRRP